MNVRASKKRGNGLTLTTWSKSFSEHQITKKDVAIFAFNINTLKYLVFKNLPSLLYVYMEYDKFEQHLLELLYSSIYVNCLLV